jgi:hypothetical protein
MEKYMSNEDTPMVFLSYSYDTESHTTWVYDLAVRLRNNGVDVIFDQFDTKIGSDIILFIEQGLDKSHKVICICSENYVKKADSGKSGVGYEKMILSSKMLRDSAIDWVMPVIINNSSEKKTPQFLSTKKYIDFSDLKNYEKNYFMLIRDIYDYEANRKPILGKNPFSNNENISDVIAGMNLVKMAGHISHKNVGTTRFNYMSNSGLYVIGEGTDNFNTEWSTCGLDSVYAVKNFSNITSIACSSEEVHIEIDDDLSSYDFSSRTRIAKIGNTVIWVNKNGKILLTKITNVEYINEQEKYLSLDFKLVN